MSFFLFLSFSLSFSFSGSRSRSAETLTFSLLFLSRFLSPTAPLAASRGIFGAASGRRASLIIRSRSSPGALEFLLVSASSFFFFILHS